MIDALLPSKKARIALLAVFALLVMLIGSSPLAAQPASASATYNGVRIVDSEGDPIGGVILTLQSDSGSYYFFTTDGLGEAFVGDFRNWDGQGFPSSVDAGVDFYYGPIGSTTSHYVWAGGSTLETWGEPAFFGTFSAAGEVPLELVVPVDQPDGSIAGTVTLDPPIPGVRGGYVELYGTDDNVVRVGQALSDTSGNFSFTGVPAGSYKLAFTSGSTSESSPYGYVSQYYDDKGRDFASANVITVAEGQAVTGIDQTLEAYALVQGFLGAVADDLDSPTVAFFPASWTSPDWDSPEIQWIRAWQHEFSATVKPGSYRIAFGDRVTGEAIGEWEWDYNFTPVEYWDGKSTLAASSIVQIVGGTSNRFDGLDSPSFTDLAPGSQFAPEIAWLASSGVTTGYPDGTFRPVGTVNRDAMAAFLYRFAGSPTFTPPPASPFSDVPKSNQFYKEITWLADTGITTGYPDGTFRPLATVNRDAMAAFLYRFVESPAWTAPSSSPFIDIATSSQFFDEITWLANTGITTGYPDGTYRPLATVNRDAMAAFLYRLSGQL